MYKYHPRPSSKKTVSLSVLLLLSVILVACCAVASRAELTTVPATAASITDPTAVATVGSSSNQQQETPTPAGVQQEPVQSEKTPTKVRKSRKNGKKLMKRNRTPTLSTVGSSLASLDRWFDRTMDMMRRRHLNLQRWFDSDFFDTIWDSPFNRASNYWTPPRLTEELGVVSPTMRGVRSAVDEKDDKYSVEFSNLPKGLTKENINLDVSYEGNKVSLVVSAKTENTSFEQRYTFSSNSHVDMEKIHAKFDKATQKLSIEIQKQPTELPVNKQITIE